MIHILPYLIGAKPASSPSAGRTTYSDLRRQTGEFCGTEPWGGKSDGEGTGKGHVPRGWCLPTLSSYLESGVSNTDLSLGGWGLINVSSSRTWKMRSLI